MIALAESGQLKTNRVYVRRNAKSKPELTPDDAATRWPKRQRGEV